MKRSNKILLGVVLALIFIIACGTAGFLKASQHKQATNKITNTTKSVNNTNSKSNHPVTTSKATDDNFSKTAWTAGSALDFLQKVNDASSEGAKVVGEKYAKYSYDSRTGHFPGNSIFLFENNRSGVGDGGVVLTKNADNTVTLTIGEGAGSSPISKAVIDSSTYNVVSQNQIHVHNQESMWEYFGVKGPGDNQSSKDDSSSDDSNSSDDNQSDNNDNHSSDDNKSDNNDDSSSNDNNSDSNKDNSQNSDTKQNNDNSDDD